MMQVIFTDLDGTLLDHDTYSYEKATKALHMTKELNVPIVFCTSKNKSEIEYYKELIGNKDPFIVENGGAIYVPKNYFDFEFEHDAEDEKYYVIKLGKSYQDLVSALKEIKKEHEIVGFSDMSPEELANDSALSLEQATLAKKREFDEAFKLINPEEETTIIEKIKREGYNHTKGGRYHHIIGDNDKGRAVKILIGLYKKKDEKTVSVAVGDSSNDFEMLDVVDLPILVQKKDGSYASPKEEYNKIDGVGPEGWNKAIIEVFT